MPAEPPGPHDRAPPRPPLPPTPGQAGPDERRLLRRHPALATRNPDGGSHIYLHGAFESLAQLGTAQSILRGLHARIGLPVRVNGPRPALFRHLPDMRSCDRVSVHAPTIAAPSRRTPLFPLRLHLALRDLRETGGRRTLDRDSHAALRETLETCAAVILLRGPDWGDRRTSTAEALEHWLFLEAARHFGTPVYRFETRFGPFVWNYPRRAWMRPLVRGALDCHDMIFLQDSGSDKMLLAFGVRPKVSVTIDRAMFLVAAPNPAFAGVEARIRSGHRPKLAAFLHSVDTADLSPADFHEKLAALLDRVQRDLADILFLGTLQRAESGSRSGEAVARDVQRRMTERGSTIVETPIHDAAALKHLLRHVDALISTRVHPALLALDHGIPCFLLSEGTTKADVLRESGLIDDPVPPHGLDVERSARWFARVMRKPALREEIRTRFARLKARHSGDLDQMYAQIIRRADRIGHA